MHIGRIQGSRLFKGQMDEVRFYRRALDVKEIQALLEPGRTVCAENAPEPPQELTLNVGGREFTGTHSSTGISGSSFTSGATAGERPLWGGLEPLIGSTSLQCLKRVSLLLNIENLKNGRPLARRRKSACTWISPVAHPYKLVAILITVPAREGPQEFERVRHAGRSPRRGF